MHLLSYSSSACQNVCTVCVPSSTNHSRRRNARTKCPPSSHSLFGSKNVFFEHLPSSHSPCNAYLEHLLSSLNLSKSQNACTKHLITSHSLSWSQNACTIPTRPFTRPHKTLTHVIYRIAGNFRGRKLPQIGEIYDFRGENFRGKNFHELLACVVLKDATPQNFAQNTFANSHKTVKFAKVFSKVSRYMVAFPEVKTHFQVYHPHTAFRKVKCVSRMSTILIQPFQRSNLPTKHLVTQPFLNSKCIFRTSTILTQPFVIAKRVSRMLSPSHSPAIAEA